MIGSINGNIDLYNDCYKDADKNFEQALILNDYEYTHSDLINMLSKGDIMQKQIAALKLENIESTKDAEILLSNLTGCDGKIREATAFTINKILTTHPLSGEIFSKSASKIFADATIDINANICRLVIDSALLLKDYTEFSRNYTEAITEYTQKALEELDKFIFRDKKYVIINKSSNCIGVWKP